MLSRILFRCIKLLNFNLIILLRGSSYIYCRNFMVMSLLFLEKNEFENCYLKYSMSTLTEENQLSNQRHFYGIRNLYDMITLFVKQIGVIFKAVRNQTCENFNS